MTNSDDHDLAASADSDLKQASLDRQMYWVRVIAVSLVVVGLVTLAWGLQQFGPTTTDLDGLGSFLSGTVGVVWSLAGIMMIYVAFLGQRRQMLLQEEDLRLNRVDLRDTRKELKGQKEALEAQLVTAKRQQFENTFFQLVRLHGEILAAVHISDAYGEYDGRGAFVRLAKILEEQYLYFIGRREDAQQEAYEQVYNLYGGQFGHYFRNLYHIVKFVDRSDVDDKNRYVSFVRAQLSTGELQLLCYNGLSRYGRDKFKPLIERYSLLKQLPREKLLEPTDREDYVSPAFGDDAV
jgi:hypothetical protein